MRRVARVTYGVGCRPTVGRASERRFKVCSDGELRWHVEVRYVVEPDWSMTWGVCITDHLMYGFHLYSPLTNTGGNVVRWPDVWEACDDLLEDYLDTRSGGMGVPISTRSAATSMVRVANLSAIWWQCRDAGMVAR